MFTNYTFWRHLFLKALSGTVLALKRKIIYLLFSHVLGLHCCAWAFSSCCERASHRHAFSCCRAPALGIEGFHSCSGTGAQLPHGMWDLPRPGIELVSLALQGRFLTTGPPGKPAWVFLRVPDLLLCFTK